MNSITNDFNTMIELVEKVNGEISEKDPYRQNFHLMPPTGWLNDPNGLCQYKGRYHVFYQYAPFNAFGGEKFWGHFSSSDLLSWKKEKVFLCPSEVFDVHGIYSGSTLVKNDKMYCFYTGNALLCGDYDYTYAGRQQNTVMVECEDGITAGAKKLLLKNEDYPENLSCDVRDPKVFEEDGHFYMILGARRMDDIGMFLIYESGNLMDWKHINTITTKERFGYMWECPDLFKIDGQYVICLSPQGIDKKQYDCQNVYSCGYFTLNGDFRGKCSLGDYVELDKGFDYYAQQTFLTDDGRRIALGWMAMPGADYTNSGVEEYKWQHCLTVMRELRFDGQKIIQLPVRELEDLRRDKQEIKADGETVMKIDRCSDIILQNEGGAFLLLLGNDVKIRYEGDVFSLELSEKCGRGRAVRVVKTEPLYKVRVLMDRSSLEIFINDGSYVMSSRFYPGDDMDLHFKGNAVVTAFKMKGFKYM